MTCVFDLLGRYEHIALRLVEVAASHVFVCLVSRSAWLQTEAAKPVPAVTHHSCTGVKLVVRSVAVGARVGQYPVDDVVNGRVVPRALPRLGLQHGQHPGDKQVPRQHSGVE